MASQENNTINSFGHTISQAIEQEIKRILSANPGWHCTAIGTLDEMWSLADQNEVYQERKRKSAASNAAFEAWCAGGRRGSMPPPENSPSLPIVKLDGAQWLDTDAGGYTRPQNNLPSTLFVLIDKKGGN